MAVQTPVREETRTPLADTLRETRTGPPSAPPRESRGQPTPPRWRKWLVVGLALAVVAAGLGVALFVLGDDATEVDGLEPYYDTYTEVLGDGADEFVAQRQATIEDVRTTIGSRATDLLDDHYRDYGVILQDGATPADHWQQVVEDRALQDEVDRFRRLQEWSSATADPSTQHEVELFERLAGSSSDAPDAYDQFEAERFSRLAELMGADRVDE